MFPQLRQNLCGQKFKDNREVKTAVTQLLRIQDMDLYQLGIKKLVPEYNKCLRCGNNHVQSSATAVQLNINYSYQI
jgi:ferredoxin-like protein FixX